MKRMIRMMMAAVVSLSTGITPVYALDEKENWSNNSGFIPSLYQQNENQLVIDFHFNQGMQPEEGDFAFIQLPEEFMVFENSTEAEVYAYDINTNICTNKTIGTVAIRDNKAELIFENANIDYSKNKGQFSVEGIFITEDTVETAVEWRLNEYQSAQLMLPDNQPINEETKLGDNIKNFGENQEEFKENRNEDENALIDEKSPEMNDSVNTQKETDGIPEPEGTEQDTSPKRAARAGTTASVIYKTHVQREGWHDWSKDGQVSGSQGKSLRLEGLQIKVENPDFAGSILYSSHIQSIGWQEWKTDGSTSGTTGQSKRLEAIRIKLSGELANHYDVYYRVHVQNYGWLGWTKNGEKAGTEGMSKRMEAMEIILVRKGGQAPGNVGEAFVSSIHKGLVTYNTHVQTYGWLSPVADGQTSGTVGQGKRLESIQIYLNNPGGYDGSIEYKNQSKRLETIQIRLTGEISDYYDVYYRTHVQNFGWLGWTMNGGKSGSEGMAKRLEAIEIRVLPKDDTSIQCSTAYYGFDRIGSLSFSVNNASTGWGGHQLNGEIGGTTGQSKPINGIRMSIDNSSGKYTGTVQYKAHFKNSGWTGLYSNGQEVVSNNPMLAIQISLTGELSTYCDIYYRTHVAHVGWMGWAKNGQSAGNSEKSGNQIEAIQIQVVPKGTYVGENTNYYRDYIITSDGLCYVQGILVVNKKHKLPTNYAPGENPEAGAQIRKLIRDMQRQGYAISSSYSGYRSYSYQASLYNSYVNSSGQAQADRFSARPGYSEHQTGLAFDLIHSNGSLVQTSREVTWIANNAHKYGFIVRYPNGKEGITGYMPEPWHLRYVGSQASAIYASGLTLEEYLGVPGGGY